MLAETTPTIAIAIDAPVQRMADVSGTAQLTALWLHGKSPKSQKSYERDIREFASFLSNQSSKQVRLNDVDLRTVMLNDVQAFQDYLEDRKPEPRPNAKVAPTGHLSPAAVKRKLASVKSLLRFGCEVGYLRFNAAVPVKLPKPKNTVAERYLTELEIMTMIALTKNKRDRLILRLLYLTGKLNSRNSTALYKTRQVNENVLINIVIEAFSIML